MKPFPASVVIKSRSSIPAWIWMVPGATLAISLLAQVALPLPFTPVPLTGQTFGVYLFSLLLGRRKAMAAVALYLAAGAAGLPVFAAGASGLGLGPTMGYLVGMLAAAWAVGGLADRHPPRSFARAWLYGGVGSCCTFGFGLVGLAAFVPQEQVLALGLLPFIPGDLIKTALAASMASVWVARRA